MHGACGVPSPLPPHLSPSASGPVYVSSFAVAPAPRPQPADLSPSAENLGEHLTGDMIQQSPYKVRPACLPLCHLCFLLSFAAVAVRKTLPITLLSPLATRPVSNLRGNLLCVLVCW